MPARKKRSKAATQRELKKKPSDNDLCEGATKQNHTTEVLTSTQHPVSTRQNYRVVSGSLNQGNARFEYPGIQCTYLSLYAMIYAQQKHPSAWCPSDVDNCVIRGDGLFLDYFATKSETPHMLLINELPNVICLDNLVYKCHRFEEETQVGLISPEYQATANCKTYSYCIADAVANSFSFSNAALFVCAGQTLSIWKEGIEYFMFDPHSRDCNGLQCPEGNSALVIFCSMDGLIAHINSLLLDSRKVGRNSQFELVPVSIAKGETKIDKTQDDKHSEAMCCYLIDQEKRNLEYQRKRKLEEENTATENLQKTKQTFDRTTYLKQYMREKRANKLFVEKENEREAHRKKTRRKDAIYNKIEKVRDRQRKALRRQDEAYKSKENKQESQRKIERRKDDAYIQTEKERDILRKSLKRQDETYKSNENKKEAVRKTERRKDQDNIQRERKRDIHRKSLRRKDEIYKSKENEKEVQRKSKKRQDESFRVEENKKEAQRKTARRQDKAYNQEEKKRDVQRKAVRRQDESYKIKENKKEAQRKTRRREDEAYKQNEKEKDVQRKRKQRNDEISNRIEAERDCARKRRKRNDEEFREAERFAKKSKRENNLKKQKENLAAAFRKKQLRLNPNYKAREQLMRNSCKRGRSVLESIANFNAAISDSCSYVCSCCHQLWFKHSVRSISSIENIPLNKTLLGKCLTNLLSVNNIEWICTTCFYNIKKGKIPKLSVLNGMILPQKPPELDLGNLEERLIALRIPFMQIRCLGAGGQFSLKGSVVNVPAQIEPTIRALPRPQFKTETIPVKLKRMMSMTHAVRTENIRPEAVMMALKKLMSTSELYKEANISVDERWEASVDEGQNVNEIERLGSSDDSDTFSEVGDSDTLPVMTLLDEPEIRAEVISVAPSEGQRPVSLFKDPNAEYLAFPTLFCGQKRLDNSERHTNVYYSDICKWELRCVDRRIALHIPNIFFKMKKLQLEQVSSKVNLAVRRCKTKGKTYTAGYIIKDNMGESLVKLDEGYKIFRTIRNSPQYWENQKKEVFAMIRQLGLPTLFISLSANDLYWSELIISLGKIVDKKDYSRDVQENTLSWDIRTRLVQSDPVTCVRHFDHRVSQFINNVLRSPDCPFGVLNDYFYRVEFQQRGSPHIHMLAWIANAPQFNDCNDDHVVDYIDKVASCSSDVREEEHLYLECQKHRHTRTCRKGGKAVCRFGIPFPPMRRTMIIRPYEGENRTEYERHFKSIQTTLNELQQDLTFDEFLEKVDLSEDDYFKAIQTSVKAPKVFLKRKPVECRINPYMKNFIGTWKANHDIQFVLDAYACTMYIVSYISKSAKGMSELMANACKEARKGNKTLKESVRHIGNKFLNASEVSAQEAAYLILQLRMSEKSRKCEFIQTAPQEERTFLLKSKKELTELPEESTDIEADNIIKRYSRRPKVLETYCLADYVSKVVSVSKDKVSDNSEHVSEASGSDNDIDLNEENTPNINDDQNRNRYSVLRKGLKVTLRSRPKVLRYVRYNEKVDPNYFYREQLMLFHPWRNENSDLLNGFETYSDHYKHTFKRIQAKRREYEANSKMSEEIEEGVNAEEIIHFEELFPNVESVEANDAEQEPKVAETFAFYHPDSSEHAHHDLGADIGLTSHIPNDNIEILQGRMPKDEYFKLLASLNNKQREIFTHVMHSLSTAPEKQICLFITGGAGVGKSVVIRVLYQALHRHFCSDAGQNPEDIRIAVCAYTGLAAYNVQGSTLHSTFCIEPNKKLKYKQLSDDKRNTLRTKFRDLSVLIVDEVSMVGNGMLNILYHRLQEIKCNYHQPFGGVHIILVGDLFQLRPVGDSWIFADCKEGYASLATNLWKTHFLMFELTEIMRQKEDQTFAELLNRVREGKQTEDDIALLKSRSVSLNTERYISLKEYQHLFPCNEDVDKHNDAVFDLANTDKAEIGCIDTVLGEHRDDVKRTVLKCVKNTKTSETGNLMNIIKVAVGLCYDTSHNISVDDGLCNGTPCVLRKIQYLDKHSAAPSCLWVQFSNSSIGREARRKYNHYYTEDINRAWTPIWAVKRTFMYRNKAVVRQQFPLKPSSGKTIHKSQGQTKEQIVVDTTRGARAHHHYVAYSRVTSIHGLHLLNGLNGTIHVDKNVLEEMRRMRINARLKLSYKPVHAYTSDLVVVFQNAQSLHAHFSQVQNDKTFTDADVLGFAETRFCQDDKDDEYKIKGFKHVIRNDEHSQCRTTRPAHGLAVYVKNCHEVIRVEKISFPLFESIILNLQNCKTRHKYTVIVVYKSPRCGSQEFTRHMKNLSSCRKEEKVVILGDFNFDVANSQCAHFVKTMTSFFPTISRLYTPPTTHWNTVLDVSFSSCENATANILTCVWSYHHTLIVSVE